jgi:hypothetical protein
VSSVRRAGFNCLPSPPAKPGGAPFETEARWLLDKYEQFFGSEAKALIGYLKEEKLPKAEPQKRNREPVIAKYVDRGQMTVGASNKWQTFSRKEKLFQPTAVTPDVKYCRILLLPFWPPGEYYVDNVRLVEVPDPKAAKDD